MLNSLKWTNLGVMVRLLLYDLKVISSCHENSFLQKCMGRWLILNSNWPDPSSNPTHYGSFAQDFFS